MAYDSLGSRLYILATNAYGTSPTTKTTVLFTIDPNEAGSAMIEAAKMIENGENWVWRHYSAILSIDQPYLPVAGFSQKSFDDHTNECFLHIAKVTNSLEAHKDFKIPAALCLKWDKGTLSVPSVTLFDSITDDVFFGASQSSHGEPVDSLHNLLFRVKNDSPRILEIVSGYKVIGMRIADENLLGVILSATNG